jgi:predicted Rossmann fold flavoprotein
MITEKNRRRNKSNVIIIGAGASGLMCALEAGKRGRSVVVIDHVGSPAKKIRVSGGGKCNFTNLGATSENYLSFNPPFCKSAIARFKPQDFIKMLDMQGIGYYEKEQGQMFCSEGSVAIANMFKKECAAVGVKMLLNCRVDDIKKDGLFVVTTNLGVFESESLVIATGGLSYPKLGASGFGHKIAESFGLNITPLKPALVPLTLQPYDLKALSGLSGVSLNVEAGCNKARFRGEMLFTHRGLSGPVILQVSLYLEQGDVITINLLPDNDALQLLIEKRRSGVELRNLLSFLMPKRLAHKLCETYIKSKPMNSYNDKELKEAAYLLHNWKLKPSGTEGYSIAEVTAGGVNTDELSSKTMESVKVSGLYFAGEVIDVTGQLGGYNLHWAWASGYAAGQYA